MSISPASNGRPDKIPADIGLCVGAEFLDGVGTKIRLERIEGVEVDLRSLRTNSLLSVRNPDGSTSRPTLDWMRGEYAAHRLSRLGPVPEGASERQARFLMLDVNIATDKDKKAKWRKSLAWRARVDETVNTDKACEDWLDANYGRVPDDLTFPRPSGSSLRRWMRKLIKGNDKIGSLVSQAGRPRNHSQLEPEVDAAVTSAALYFYSAPGINQVMAESYLKELIDTLNATLPPGRIVPYKQPSRQTLRSRIFKLECWDTWSKKHGREAAERKYRGAGEPLLVDHVFEVGLMDATQLEQIIVFDENWQIPALKVRITAIMDALSHAIMGWNVYAGPNRGETSAQAFLHCMEPNKFPERMVRLHPGLKLLFGRFASLLPDNEKALVGPETMAGYNEAGTTIIPAPVDMPTAKAALERFWRTLKETLAQLPGTLIDPKHASELGFENVESAAELTLHQLREIVAQVVAQFNVSESRGLGGRSPMEVVNSRIATRATPAFEDMGAVRAALARTFPIFVSRNGAEKDGIRYRDAKAIDGLYDNNAGRLGGVSKHDGFRMRGRRNDGNIDKIEVYDAHAGVWVELPSTQPAYTAGLSLWEHQQYTAAAKKRREAFGSAQAKLASKAETRRLIEETLPKAKFRRKSAMASLALSAKVGELNGTPIVLPQEVEVANQAVINFRKDDPTEGREPAMDGKKPPKQTIPDERPPSDAADRDDWDTAELGEDEA